MTIPAGPSKNWPGIDNSTNIDAAFIHDDRETYMFQGDKVYKWDFNGSNFHLPDGKLASGYPKKIKDEFPGLPNDLDTAFRWNVDYQIYFFKGDFFYIWDSKTKSAKGVYQLEQWKNLCEVYKCPTEDTSSCLKW